MLRKSGIQTHAQAMPITLGVFRRFRGKKSPLARPARTEFAPRAALLCAAAPRYSTHRGGATFARFSSLRGSNVRHVRLGGFDHAQANGHD
jgi:hypothetical protein